LGGNMIYGIDVARYQANTALKSQVPVHQIEECVSGRGIQFAYVKLSEAKFTDGAAPSHAETMRAHLRIGGYHFFRPTVDVAAQVEVFHKSYLSLSAVELPPAIDIEDSKAIAAIGADQVLRNAIEFCELLELRTNRPTVIYTYTNHWLSELVNKGNAALRERLANRRPLWLAQYPFVDKAAPPEWVESHPPKPLPEWAGRGWSIWQFDGDKGHRFPNGVDSDFNVFNGDEAMLDAFCAASLVPPTQPSLAPVMPEFDGGRTASEVIGDLFQSPEKSPESR
jgi:GH25 family lysozyme M1 (1,4-beta-N-acetylmuramidase)